MYQDVGRLTEHRFAHSLSEAPSSVAPTNSSHADDRVAKVGVGTFPS